MKKLIPLLFIPTLAVADSVVVRATGTVAAQCLIASAEFQSMNIHQGIADTPSDAVDLRIRSNSGVPEISLRYTGTNIVLEGGNAAQVGEDIYFVYGSHSGNTVLQNDIGYKIWAIIGEDGVYGGSFWAQTKEAGTAYQYESNAYLEGTLTVTCPTE